MKTSRNTNAKSVIVDVLLQSDSALSHAEIQLRTNGICDRVTIYRVLERLINDDLIHKTVNLEGIVRYAHCNSIVENHSHNHVHFSCQKCNLVTCLLTVVPKFTLPDNYQIKDVNFTVAGLCPNCI